MSKGLIHHVEINVSNLENSVAFWGWFLEKLGYELYQTWNKGRSWKLGESYLVFVQAEEIYFDVSYHRKQVGLNHPAFYADSREHVDLITWQLRQKGISILYKELHPFAGGEGALCCFFRGSR